MVEPTMNPGGVLFITATSLKPTTATASSDSMGTGSTAATSTDVDGGEKDKDNVAAGEKLGRAVYVLVSAFFITGFPGY
jgi:hypothetical protein